jgi:predicted membrane protein
LAFGDESVDLTAVQFPATGTTVDVSVAVGSVNVYVPADAVVLLQTQVGIGSVWSVTQSAQNYYFNPFQELPSNNMTPAQIARAPHVTLNIQTGIGNINVTRTAPPKAPTPPSAPRH